MAELDASPGGLAGEAKPWTSAQTRAQILAIAWLRWRIFVNVFRAGKKRSAAKWIVVLLLRLVVWTLLGTILLAPIAVCGGVGYLAIADQRGSLISAELWAIFLIGFFVSLNVPAALAFDLTPLLRFPVRLSQYVGFRLIFSLGSIPTVVANVSLLATAIGMGVARATLLLPALTILGVYGACNLLFLRMVFSWVDRWMGTRRAREVLGGLVLVASLTFQFVISSPSSHRAGRYTAARHLLAPLHPVTQYLAPSLAADALLSVARQAYAHALAETLGVLAFAAAFLAIFALRAQKEFRGENLSEAVARAATQTRIPRTISRPGAAGAAGVAAETRGHDEPYRALLARAAVAACLSKELIYLRRSSAQLYGLVTPIIFVFILARRNGLFSAGGMLLPYAVSYTLFGLLGSLYNVLGADGAGFNFYLLAPIRLRDTFLAKNILSGCIFAAEILLTCGAVSWINGGLPPVAMLSATLTWAVFAVLVNLSVGNIRSVTSPMRFELGKTRRPPTAKGSALVSLGTVVGTLACGAPVIYLCHRFGSVWIATPIFVLLAAAAAAGYLLVLGRIDALAASHRDTLIDALCKG